MEKISSLIGSFLIISEETRVQKGAKTTSIIGYQAQTTYKHCTGRLLPVKAHRCSIFIVRLVTLDINWKGANIPKIKYVPRRG